MLLKQLNSIFGLNKNVVFYNKFLKFNKLLYHSVPNPNNDPKVDENQNDELLRLIDKYEDKIIYNSFLEEQKLKLGYHKNKIVEDKLVKKIQKEVVVRNSIEPLPVSLKYLNKQILSNTTEDSSTENIESDEPVTQFPFEAVDKFEENDNKNDSLRQEFVERSIKDEVLARKAKLDKTNWMTDYEYYDDSIVEDQNSWQINYGTPNPNSSVSKVPCGGCGALLHCKDTSIPGYIPSEIFLNHRKEDTLKSLICQRCHFLKYYDTALQVRVTPEEYPKILKKINETKMALVILMVDVLDFPCSVWPNIIEIIGNRKPVVVVGNKIDLLPQDGKGYLYRITKILEESIRISCLASANIQHVALISSKTGFGVEDLITKLHSLWDYRGDVYLIGCTNVGKSTLFNALLQSDYCKIQAADLVQRATTSVWPGTTLNLLKFPILKPTPWRLHVRYQRLKSLYKMHSREHKLRKIQLRKSDDPKYAMLIGHIERTFSAEEPVTNETKDIFSLKGQTKTLQIGINEDEPLYKFSKWCYDTPGVVHPEQILHLLTTEELMLTLPKSLIQARTFSIKPGQTIFLAGLGRLDYLKGPQYLRFIVFSSKHLPVTICNTSEAAELYANLLGTEMFKVPLGNSEERLQKWPNLEACEDIITLEGIDWECSSKDIVLSNAGWISASCGENIEYSVRAWTPGKKGIFVRESLLPHMVKFRGQKIRRSPAYKKPRLYKV